MKLEIDAPDNDASLPSYRHPALRELAEDLMDVLQACGQQRVDAIFD